jgi:hypothetical protein
MMAILEFKKIKKTERKEREKRKALRRDPLLSQLTQESQILKKN